MTSFLMQLTHGLTGLAILPADQVLKDMSAIVMHCCRYAIYNLSGIGIDTITNILITQVGKQIEAMHGGYSDNDPSCDRLGQ